MAGLRGPDSSEDERHLGGNAVFPETVDVNIRQLDPIPAPRYFLRELPLTDDMSDLVLQSRQEIRDILHGRDDRLLVIVGPCSIHDPKAAHEYAQRLAALKGELEDRLMIVMRVYFEKPRTTIGWKGLINDPDLDGRFDIRKGMWLARKVLTDVLGLGLPTATEWLDPITPQYICDLISWGAIGARNTESQVHRELASGMSMPIGFKNATDGSVKPAADSCFAAGFEHHFLSINLDGRVISAETKGNPDCHLILRGDHAPARTTMRLPWRPRLRRCARRRRAARANAVWSSMRRTAIVARTRTSRPRSLRTSPHVSPMESRASSAS